MSYHLAVIPDGNRRYARNHDIPKRKGHEKGFDNAKNIVEKVDDHEDIDELTIWGLSYDNAEKRSQKEVNYLNRIFQELAEYLSDELPERNAELKLAGDRDKVQDKTVEMLQEVVEDTEGNEGLTVYLLLGYDGRHDITQAAQELYEKDEYPTREKLYEELEVPEIDVVLGYGDERAHISHLANWQVGYSTLHFPHKNFPDADVGEIKEAIDRHEERKKSRGA